MARQPREHERQTAGKRTVDLAMTTDLFLFTPPLVVDGVTTTAGMKIIAWLPGEVAEEETYGLYEVVTPGIEWVRDEGWNESVEFRDFAIWVPRQGVENAGRAFVMWVDDPDSFVLGTDPIRVRPTDFAAIKEVNGQRADIFVDTANVYGPPVVLHENQLVEDGILPATAFLFETFTPSNRPDDGDTFSIANFAVTETYTWRDTPVGAFDVQRGVTGELCLENLASTINTSSVGYTAVYVSGVTAYRGLGVLFIIKDTLDWDDDRIYGSIQSGCDPEFVNFSNLDFTGLFPEGLFDYSLALAENLPTADPGVQTGFNREITKFDFNRHMVSWVTVEPFGQMWAYRVQELGVEGEWTQIGGGSGGTAMSSDEFETVAGNVAPLSATPATPSLSAAVDVRDFSHVIMVGELVLNPSATEITVTLRFSGKAAPVVGTPGDWTFVPVDDLNASTGESQIRTYQAKIDVTTYVGRLPALRVPVEGRWFTATAHVSGGSAVGTDFNFLVYRVANG